MSDYIRESEEKELMSGFNGNLLLIETTPLGNEPVP